MMRLSGSEHRLRTRTLRAQTRTRRDATEAQSKGKGVHRALRKNDFPAVAMAPDYGTRRSGRKAIKRTQKALARRLPVLVERSDARQQSGVVRDVARPAQASQSSARRREARDARSAKRFIKHHEQRRETRQDKARHDARVRRLVVSSRNVMRQPVTDARRGHTRNSCVRLITRCCLLTILRCQSTSDGKPTWETSRIRCPIGRGSFHGGWA